MIYLRDWNDIKDAYRLGARYVDIERQLHRQFVGLDGEPINHRQWQYLHAGLELLAND